MFSLVNTLQVDLILNWPCQLNRFTLVLYTLCILIWKGRSEGYHSKLNTIECAVSLEIFLAIICMQIDFYESANALAANLLLEKKNQIHLSKTVLSLIYWQFETKVYMWKLKPNALRVFFSSLNSGQDILLPNW